MGGMGGMGGIGGMGGMGGMGPPMHLLHLLDGGAPHMGAGPMGPMGPIGGGPIGGGPIGGGPMGGGPMGGGPMGGGPMGGGPMGGGGDGGFGAAGGEIYVDGTNLVHDGRQPRRAPHRGSPHRNGGGAPPGRARTSHASPRGGREHALQFAREHGGALKPPHTADSAALASPPRRAPSYTPYTGKVENLAPRDTGRLKPDLHTDELLAKRAAKDRVKLFSKNLKTVNRQIIDDQIEFAPPKPPVQREPTKHEKARQYAAQVPRPRLREPVLASAPGADAAAAEVAEAGMDEGELLLLRLERQHEEQQRQAQAIRQELGLN
jgi:hypothetical protein